MEQNTYQDLVDLKFQLQGSLIPAVPSSWGSYLEGKLFTCFSATKCAFLQKELKDSIFVCVDEEKSQDSRKKSDKKSPRCKKTT